MEGFGKATSKNNNSNPRTIINAIGQSLYRNAINHHRRGDLAKAENDYREAIRVGYLHHAIYSNLGVICNNSGRAKEAIYLYKKSIEIFPGNPDAYLNLSILCKGSGDLDQALAYALKYIELKPTDPNGRMHLGILYKDLGRLNEALETTLKSIELKPTNPSTYKNLGGIYKSLGCLDQALTSTLKCIQLKPDNPSAYKNLGEIYKDLGNLDMAIESTLKSIKLEPTDPAAHLNMAMTYEAINELDHALSSYTLAAALSIKHKEEIRLTSLVSSSIIFLQKNKIEKALALLTEARKISSAKTKIPQQAQSINEKNNIAYLRYLDRLIPEIPATEALHDSQIIHIGESHCLAFINQKIQAKDIKLLIKPSLIKGAKAFHLREASKTSIQKIGFERRTQQDIGSYKYIFLSFGEIDCRADEGIMKHCQKTGNAIKDTSREIANLYFEWTAQRLSTNIKKVVYFGTPAPYKTEQIKNQSTEDDDRRLLAIRIFNATIKEQCEQNGIFFADVYRLTAGKDGYNNNDWMIDGIHLKPKALNSLMKGILF